MVVRGGWVGTLCVRRCKLMGNVNAGNLSQGWSLR